MGTSTDGELNFGIVYKEGVEFPWDDVGYDSDVEKWWRDVNGFSPSFNPYDDDGNYFPGVEENDPRILKYHDEERDWNEANPMPVSLVNYCSDKVPAYLLAVPGKGYTANRGHPQLILPSALCDAEAEIRESGACEKLVAFCKKYIGEELPGGPGWYLTSYWG